MVLTPKDRCPYETERDTDTGRGCVERGRLGDGATSPRVQEPPEAKEAGGTLPWDLWRERGPGHTFISGVWPPERGEDMFVVF